MVTRQMKRQFDQLGLPNDGQPPAKKSRTEQIIEQRTKQGTGQSTEQQSVPQASSEPRTRALQPKGGHASSAQSAKPSAADTTVPSKRVRFQVDTEPTRASAGPIPAPTVDSPRTPIQIIDQNDLRALEALLQGVARGWSMADKADLLRHAAGTGKLDAFDVLLEFGALQALRGEAPRPYRYSLIEYAALGQHTAILDRLEASGLAVRSFARDELVAAIGISGRKGGLAFLQRLCDAADAAGIRFQPIDMRKIFIATVQWEKNDQCQRIASTAVMEWLMARYPGSFDATVFAAPLWKAIDVGNWSAAEYLLGACGASPHLVGDGDRSLLMMAAARGRYNLFDLLCFHGADPHAIDADGQSVLHYAVLGQGPRIVSDLALQFRVDTDIRDKQGKTPVDLALQQGRADLVNIMHSQPLHIDYLSSL